MDMKTNLLQWVTEDSRTLQEEGRAPAVPIHLLLVKLALMRKTESDLQSASTELSLQVFERSQVFRHLRDLAADGELTFVDQTGEPLSIDSREMQDFSQGDAGRIKFVTVAKR